MLSGLASAANACAAELSRGACDIMGSAIRCRIFLTHAVVIMESGLAFESTISGRTVIIGICDIAYFRMCAAILHVIGLAGAIVFMEAAVAFQELANAGCAGGNTVINTADSIMPAAVC